MPPCASRYSTQAHFGDVGRSVTRPATAARRRASFASITSIASNGAPSSGVLRLATKGAIPSTTRGAMRDSSMLKRPSSSMSAIVSPGSPSIM